MASGKLLYNTGEFSPVFHNNLKRWYAVWQGQREAQEGGAICIFMTDSHCCKAETNTILLTITLQLKIEKKKFKKTVSNDICLILVRELRTFMAHGQSKIE